MCIKILLLFCAVCLLGTYEQLRSYDPHLIDNVCRHWLLWFPPRSTLRVNGCPISIRWSQELEDLACTLIKLYSPTLNSCGQWTWATLLIIQDFSESLQRRPLCMAGPSLYPNIHLVHQPKNNIFITYIGNSGCLHLHSIVPLRYLTAWPRPEKGKADRSAVTWEKSALQRLTHAQNISFPGHGRFTASQQRWSWHRRRQPDQ